MSPRCACCCDADDGGAEEVGSYAGNLRMAVWLGLLTAGWVLQKFLCHLGMPDDCASDTGLFTRSGYNYSPGCLAELDGLRQLLTFGAQQSSNHILLLQPGCQRSGALHAL